MSTSVTLPALGESVTEGTVTRWLKQVGDTVAADEPLLEISTDKVDTEIPSPAAGVLLEIKAQEDETVEVGAELGVIGDADEAPSDSAGDQGGEAEEAAEPEAEQAPEPEAAPEPEQAEPEQAPAAEAKPASGGAASGTEITLPALGESVTEGTVSRWLKAVGDSVETDEALLEISTDKVDTEIPSPTSGTLLEIRVQEDETVEVGAVLAVVGDENAAPAGGEDEAPSEPAKEEAAAEPEPKTPEAEEPKQDEPKAEAPKAEAPQAEAPKQEAPKQESAPAPAAAPKASGDSEGTYVTPLVRKLAAEHQVDLASLTGTGVGGRIRKQDVIAAADAAKAKPEAQSAPAAATADSGAAAAATVQPSSLRGTTEKLSRLRKTIATRMVESLQVAAQLTTVVEVDLTNISRLRAKVKDDFLAREGVKLSYLPFLVKASVDALKVHPKVNATLDLEAGTVTYPASENVSIAVDTEQGLLVPVLKEAGDLSLAGIARKIADLAERSRTKKLVPDDLAGGTFTVTNTGSRGALFDTPIINQPQSAILGTGTIVKRPVVMTDKVLGETIAVRDMMYLALSYDHRIVDGADAARFLSTLKERLEEGDFEAEFGL